MLIKFEPQNNAWNMLLLNKQKNLQMAKSLRHIPFLF